MKKKCIKVKSDILRSLLSIVRQVNGRGNNLANNNFGSTNEPLIRKAAAKYTNNNGGIDKKLPEPRLLSNTFGQLTNGMQPNRFGVNMLFGIWGQFLDHDLGQTRTQGTSGERIFMKVPKCD